MSGGFKYVENNRVSKAQKRRDAKAAKKAEQIKRIEEAEKLDENKERRLEQEKLDNVLRKKQLDIYDIDADGDCLYRAAEHQLSIASDSEQKYTCQELRDKTSQYMLENADDFMPFLINDQGDLMSLQDYKNYCNRISKTKEWGGHLELTAISQFTKKPIHIYQAEGDAPIIIEPRIDLSKSPIILSFHKHLYHLGEHYNSLMKSS